MTARSAQLWKLNHRLLTAVLDACATEFERLGFDTKEFFVLAEVEASPYPAELAATLVIPKASMTAYVRSLVEKGMLRREIDDADLRRHRLLLTERGIRARDAALDLLTREFDARLSRISADDRATLTRILGDLVGDSSPAQESSSRRRRR